MLTTPTFAKELCAKLKLNTQLFPQYLCLDTFDVSCSSPLGSAKWCISPSKDYISWHTLSCLVWLNFGNRFDTERVSDQFNTEVFRESAIKLSPPIRRVITPPIDSHATLKVSNLTTDLPNQGPKERRVQTNARLIWYALNQQNEPTEQVQQ